MGRYSGKKCRLLSMFILTLTFFLLEIIVGYVTNSMALVADSFHMLSDVLAIAIAFISVLIAPKSWSKNTFGWARAEVLGALVNAVFLIALCFSILVEALKRFYKPEDIENPVLILWVGGAGLLVNIIGLFLFREHGGGGHTHGHHHKLPTIDEVMADEDISEHPDNYHVPDATRDSCSGLPEKEKAKMASSSQMNMRGVFLHVLADALGSVIVILSALIIWLTDWYYKNYVDPALSLIMVCLIMRSTWPLLVESALILLQTVPTHIQVDSLQQKLLREIQGVLAVHEFHVWQLAGERIIASAHIRCRNLADYMKIAEKVKEFFHNEGIHSTTIQPEFEDLSNDKSTCALDCPSETKCSMQTCCGTKKDLKESPRPGHNVTENGSNTELNNHETAINDTAIDVDDRNFEPSPTVKPV